MLFMLDCSCHDDLYCDEEKFVQCYLLAGDAWALTTIRSEVGATQILLIIWLTSSHFAVITVEIILICILIFFDT